jgi:hypothetical protein
MSLYFELHSVEHLVRIAPSTGVLGGIWLLSLQACVQTASRPRYVVIFSSENMTCGPWVALLSACWVSGSLLDILAGSDGYKASNCILS